MLIAETVIVHTDLIHTAGNIMTKQSDVQYQLDEGDDQDVQMEAEGGIVIDERLRERKNINIGEDERKDHQDTIHQNKLVELRQRYEAGELGATKSDQEKKQLKDIVSYNTVKEFPPDMTMSHIFVD